MREEIYRAAAKQVPVSAIHEVLHRKGPAILDRGVPYLIRAAKNRLTDEYRRAVRTESLDPESGLTESLWDPAELLISHDVGRRVVEAIAELPPTDAAIIWRTAEGVSAEDILAELSASGVQMSHEALRQRRSRIRKRLRTSIGALDD